MGSDYHQCYSGDISGIVGINLQVEPIAYKILLNRRALRHYVQREIISNLAEESFEPHRRGLNLRDKKLVAIVEEVKRYIDTPAYERIKAKERQELQEY